MQSEGEISYVDRDGGMLVTVDQQSLRFTLGDCRDFVPRARQRVRIERVDGMSATGLTWLADPPAPAYDPEDKYAGYQLTVLFDQPLTADADKLASILRGGALATPDVAAYRVVLEASIDNLEIRMNGHSLLAQHVHMPFPAAHMDLRYFDEPFDPGLAFVGITGPVIPLARVRPMVGPDLPHPWGTNGVSRAVHAFALRLIELGGKAVVSNQAGERVRTAAEFKRMSGDLADPNCVPFEPWLDFATANAGRLVLRCWGMIAFGLMDLAVELQAGPDSPGFQGEINGAANAVLFAASSSIRRNREFSDGEQVGVPVSVGISAGDPQTFLPYRIERGDEDRLWVLRRESARTEAG